MPSEPDRSRGWLGLVRLARGLAIPPIGQTQIRLPQEMAVVAFCCQLAGLVKRLRQLGFEGPLEGGQHPYMVHGDLVVTILTHTAVQ